MISRRVYYTPCMEIVPGVRFGDGVGVGAFWESLREQQDKIREGIEKSYGHARPSPLFELSSVVLTWTCSQRDDETRLLPCVF